MARILVFGGSFSPPTLAHEAIIGGCLALPGFAELWVMPSADRTDKQIGVSGQHRLAMLEAVQREIFHSDPRLRISDFELQLPAPSATARTVAALETTYPAHEFWFVFGTDSYYDMPHWPDGARLQATLKLVIINRGTEPLPSRPGIRPLRINGMTAISSTQTRQVLQAGADSDTLLSQPVQAYIHAHQLYHVA
ncbi:MAG TPA: nicotinate-nicotinamide nucleotide adenylyltransferase [Candidatus Saccharimonadales bacterium]|nr:nicotinate-nicotinamide nucleotide adenylyltransferase [Candidatus Saccharimonadales bacterium]